MLVWGFFTLQMLTDFKGSLKRLLFIESFYSFNEVMEPVAERPLVDGTSRVNSLFCFRLCAASALLLHLLLNLLSFLQLMDLLIFTLLILSPILLVGRERAAVWGLAAGWA